MPCYKPLNKYVDPTTGHRLFRAEENHPGGTYAHTDTYKCGQCIGCRIDRSTHWAARIVHHAQQYGDNNCFVTLTYNDENLPENGSLNKHDIQKFFKKLRRKFDDRKITYFQCGEYGDKNDRPHHHACIFNFTPDVTDSEDVQLFSEREGICVYTSKVLEERWGHGFATFGALEYMSAAYVARYALKKVNGERAKDHYLRADQDGVAYWLEPEYITMSKGIGKSWYDQYKRDLFPSDEMPVPGRGVFKKIARYYEKILEENQPDDYAKLKANRQLYYDTHKEDYTLERLAAKRQVKIAQLNKLKRTL